MATRVAVGYVLLVCVSLAAFFAYKAAVYDMELRELRAEVAALTAELESAKQELAGFRAIAAGRKVQLAVEFYPSSPMRTAPKGSVIFLSGWLVVSNLSAIQAWPVDFRVEFDVRANSTAVEFRKPTPIALRLSEGTRVVEVPFAIYPVFIPNEGASAVDFAVAARVRALWRGEVVASGEANCTMTVEVV